MSPSMSILGSADHLPQLVLAGEVGLQGLELLDEILRTANNSFLGSDLSIGLDSKFKLGEKRMGNLRGSASFPIVRCISRSLPGTQRR